MIEFEEAVSGGEGWLVEQDVPVDIQIGSAAAPDADILLVFDGGSRGNPGQGYGSFAYKGRVVRWPVRLVFPGDRTTNNQAEYMALIGGLRAILSDLEKIDADPATMRLKIRSDSELLVHQVNGRWKVKNAGLRQLRDQVQQLLSRFKRYQVEWHPRSESVRIFGH